jgi:hypothetical protein
MQIDDVRKGFLDAGFYPQLVDEVLDSYTEAKRRYHLGDHRPQAVEGGRFSEGVFRMLQHASGINETPIGRTLPSVDRLLKELESATGSDSIRLHIPRTLKLIYDIRNRRDAAHLADGIDPNLQDATLVVGNIDWTLAELVRLYHNVDADRAQQIIENLVSKEVPVIQEIDGQPVLLSNLAPRDQALLMLYRAGARGASLTEISDWLRVKRADHLKARLQKLDTQRLVLCHPSSQRYHLTSLGVRDVEARKLATFSI